MKKIFILIPSLFFYMTHYGQDFSFEQKITAPIRSANYIFSEDVEIHGGRAYASTEVDNSSHGAIFMYEMDSTTGNWTMAQKIQSPESGTSEGFGYDFDVDGNYMVVGARLNSTDAITANYKSKAGALFVYKKNNNNRWLYDQKIVTSDRAIDDYFGMFVAIHNGRIAAGAPGHDYDTNSTSYLSNAGAAYVFELNSSGQFVEVQKIAAFNRYTQENFPQSVDIYNDHIVLGSTYHTYDLNEANSMQNAGAAFVYSRNSSGKWKQNQKFTAKTRMNFNWFGNAVDIFDSTMAISAFADVYDANEQNQQSQAGSVTLFRLQSNGKWKWEQKISAPDRRRFDHFGVSVALSEECVVVGSSGSDFDQFNQNSISSAGAAYVYKRNQFGLWSHDKKLVQSDRTREDFFGGHVAIENDVIIISCEWDDTDVNGLNPVNNAGSAFIFSTNTDVSLEDAGVLHFSGGNDVLSIDKLASTVQDMTLEWWMKKDANQGHFMVQSKGQNVQGGLDIGFNQNGQIGFALNGNTPRHFNMGGNVQPGKWTHIALVYSSRDKYIKYYQDGKLVSTNPITSTLSVATSVGLSIGDRIDSTRSWAYQGQMDEFRIWDTVRTEQQINETMNVEFCDARAYKHLMLYYDFNQGKDASPNYGDTIVKDRSNWKRDGKLYNFDLNGPQSNFIKGKEFFALDTIQVTDCYSYTSRNNVTWTSSGLYQDTIRISNACDTVYTVDLHLGTYSFGKDTVQGCYSYSSPSGLYTWTQSGIYRDVIPNAAGCDSLIDFKVNILTSLFDTISDSACDFYVNSKGARWDTSGVYTDTLVNSLGCDSILTINLKVKNLDSTVIAHQDHLEVLEKSGTYQWYLCSAKMFKMSGDTAATYYPKADGDYRVVINKGICTDTSSCYSYKAPVSDKPNQMIELVEENDVVIFPNPSQGKVTIQTKGSEIESIQVFDALGAIIRSEKNIGSSDYRIDLSEESNGIKFIFITTDAMQYTYRVVKN